MGSPFDQLNVQLPQGMVVDRWPLEQLDGRYVVAGTLAAVSWQFTLPVEKLLRGVYMLTLHGVDGHHSSVRFVKMKGRAFLPDRSARVLSPPFHVPRVPWLHGHMVTWAHDHMGSQKTAAFHTLGCKLNFAETSTLARSLEEAGYARVNLEERPNVFVLNTCSVTENADKECRQWVRRFQRINPDAFIAVVGCYAQLKPQEIAAIPGVSLVLGANEKFDLAEHIGRGVSPLSLGEGQGVRAHFSHIKETKRFIPSWNSGDRTRTFLKVQDGCDYFCSFCTIPLARGRSRSGTIAETVAIAENIARTGVKEIVLTGVNTGDFGRAHGETFLGLVRALDQVEGIARFRISSIEPNLCGDEVIDFVAGSERFMPHFHVPLQSGSDAILRRMRRRYDTALYADRVAHIKRSMPHACIGADVITGTPGETDEEFLKTQAFLRSLTIDYLHVFTYSERANTIAVRMEESVPVEVRRERTKQLRILGGKLQRAFYQRYIGSEREVLFEAEEVDGTMLGYTDNYLRVSAPYDPAMVNMITSTRLERIDGDGHVQGALCEEMKRATANW